MVQDKLHDECGVFGICSMDGADAREAAYYALYALQHRGQESTGIAVSDGTRIRVAKDKGIVPDVFGEMDMEAELPGDLAIGHVRYATAQQQDMVNAQPQLYRYKHGSIALGINGCLINGDKLRRDLEEEGLIFHSSVDTEVIANLIARYSADGFENALRRTLSIVRGSYSLVVMNEDTLIGARDPMGIRPLCLGKLGEDYLIASESCAFDAIGGKLIRDIAPGEMVIISKNGLRSVRFRELEKTALCVFEFVYLARTDSVVDGIGVYDARVAAGKRLAVGDTVEADMVIGVPDSAIPAALGYAEQSGIHYGEGLTKNRYVGRTFIQPSQHQRELSVRTKLSPLSRNVNGKRIVIVDDSIVRGTTIKKTVEMLRIAGAKEVHVRVSSPPVMWPCYFGIDTPTRDQLINAGNDAESIRRIIGADTLKFLSIEDLRRSVEGSGCDFCFACFTGEYPMDVE